MNNIQNRVESNLAINRNMDYLRHCISAIYLSVWQGLGTIIISMLIAIKKIVGQ